MEKTEIKAIFNSYTEEEQNYLDRTMTFLAICGVCGAPETAEDFRKWCDKALAERRQAIMDKETKKIKKAENERKKAEALGMTVEEMKAEQSRKRKIRNAKQRIADAEKEIKILQAKIREDKKLLKKLEG